MTEKKCLCGHLVFQNEAKNIFSQDFVMLNITYEFDSSTYNVLCSRGPLKLLAESRKTPVAAILFSKTRPKYSQARFYGYEYIPQI